MKNIQNAAASVFIIAVAVLSIVAALGVWDFFTEDVISKSYQTLSLLAVVAVIVMVAGRFFEHRSQSTEIGTVPELPNPMFKSIRNITLTILIITVSLLALLGVLAIWEVVEDKDVLYKSLSTLGIFAFGSFVIVLICLVQEGKIAKYSSQSKRMSIGAIIGLLVVAYIVLSFSRMLW